MVALATRFAGRGMCSCPLSRPSAVWHWRRRRLGVDISCQYCHRELDDRTPKLGGTSRSVGILAFGGRGISGAYHVCPDRRRFGAPAHNRLVVSQLVNGIHSGHLNICSPTNAAPKSRYPRWDARYAAVLEERLAAVKEVCCELATGVSLVARSQRSTTARGSRSLLLCVLREFLHDYISVKLLC